MRNAGRLRSASQGGRATNAHHLAYGFKHRARLCALAKARIALQRIIKSRVCLRLATKHLVSIHWRGGDSWGDTAFIVLRCGWHYERVGKLHDARSSRQHVEFGSSLRESEQEGPDSEEVFGQGTHPAGGDAPADEYFVVSFFRSSDSNERKKRAKET